MKIIDRGTGQPLVLVPGIQGRWEYLYPAVDALASRFRVVTFPLGDEPSAECAFDRRIGFDAYVAHVEAAMDQAGVQRAIVCGVSFGGLVALRFASAHPARVSGLVLASTPGPRWHLRPRHELYARFPRVFGPVFLAEAPWRLRHELAAAFPDARARRRFSWSQLRTLVAAPVSARRMAARAFAIASAEAAAHASRLTVPTLVITGQSALDHVVGADGSSEYAQLIPGARSVVLERTGHLGSITRPDAFARAVADFADRASHAAA